MLCIAFRVFVSNHVVTKIGIFKTWDSSSRDLQVFNFHKSSMLDLVAKSSIPDAYFNIQFCVIANHSKNTLQKHKKFMD